MLTKVFDPNQKYRFAAYLRMSSDLQNSRSPDQQLEEILARINRQKLPWKLAETYRDEGKSGRMKRNRNAYQQMLRDIRTRTVNFDLILVDTLERLGRVDDIATIRKQLHERHGVLVLTADTNFADPVSASGRAIGFVESIRSTEHGRILAHNVLRGKRDAARQKHWPGGKAPFGFLLSNVMKNENGREEVDHTTLVHHPVKSIVIRLLFEQARDTNWGATKLARFLNEHPEIPADLKPFTPASVGYWLDQELYAGDLVWEKKHTGIVDDMRVVERNDPQDCVRVQGFCEPIVDRELWVAVHELREDRKRAHAAKNRKTNGDKLLRPLAPGISLNYLLSGLVFCSECGVRMTVASSPVYETISGESRRYVHYLCPNTRSGACRNKTRVPEPWLRGVVVSKLVERLFGAPQD